MSMFFEYEIRLNGLDVDGRGQCKASALLNHLQNAAATADDIDDLCCKTSILIRGKEQQ